MKNGNGQTTIQTISLVGGLMAWVILSSLLPFIKEDIALTSTQLAWVTAVPVILGSILRFPFGFWTNRIGARKMFFISFLILLLPIYYLSIARSFFDLILGGLFLGISGAVFSIGVTSLPKYYPKNRHGFVNGIYGVGNIGTAISTFFAPVAANHYGWSTTIRLYLVLMLVIALVNLLLGDREEPKVHVSFSKQFASVYRNEKLWFLSLFYFITFGSFVAFTIYLPNFLVGHFHLAKVDAGLRTAGFIALATFIRPVGGWMADRLNSLKILMFVFGGITLAGVLLSFMPSLTIYTIGCLSVAFFAGIGNGTIFKLVPLYFSKQGGIVSGIVSAMGGLGGFFPPLMLTVLFNLTGNYAIGFMALSEVSLASLILAFWMYYQEQMKKKDEIFDSTVEGIILTDPTGIRAGLGNHQSYK